MRTAYVVTGYFQSPVKFSVDSVERDGKLICRVLMPEVDWDQVSFEKYQFVNMDNIT